MNRFFSALMGNKVAMLALVLIGIGATRSEAQCSSTAFVHSELMERYGQELRDIREADVAGGVVELWTNPINGSYSVLIYPRPGYSCLVDSGQSDRLKEREA